MWCVNGMPERFPSCHDLVRCLWSGDSVAQDKRQRDVRRLRRRGDCFVPLVARILPQSSFHVIFENLVKSSQRQDSLRNSYVFVVSTLTLRQGSS